MTKKHVFDGFTRTPCSESAVLTTPQLTSIQVLASGGDSALHLTVTDFLRVDGEIEGIWGGNNMVRGRLGKRKYEK